MGEGRGEEERPKDAPQQRLARHEPVVVRDDLALELEALARAPCGGGGHVVARVSACRRCDEEQGRGTREREGERARERGRGRGRTAPRVDRRQVPLPRARVLVERDVLRASGPAHQHLPRARRACALPALERERERERGAGAPGRTWPGSRARPARACPARAGARPCPAGLGRPRSRRRPRRRWTRRATPRAR